MDKLAIDCVNFYGKLIELKLNIYTLILISIPSTAEYESRWKVMGEGSPGPTVKSIFVGSKIRFGEVLIRILVNLYLLRDK